MPHNQKGNVYLSHWLGTCIPSKVFQAHPGLIDAYLELVAREMRSLFSEGVAHGPHDAVYRMAAIGVKGDLEFHVDTAKYSRSYQNVGTTVARPFCPECQAGSEGIPRNRHSRQSRLEEYLVFRRTVELKTCFEHHAILGVQTAIPL